MSAIRRTIFSPLHASPDLEPVVRQKLEDLLKLPDIKSFQGSSECLYTDIQNYLSLIVFLLPRLAESLLESQHIKDYVSRCVAKDDEETDMSETRSGSLTQKESCLREYVRCLRNFSDSLSSRGLEPEGKAMPHVLTDCSGSSQDTISPRFEKPQVGGVSTTPTTPHISAATIPPGIDGNFGGLQISSPMGNTAQDFPNPNLVFSSTSDEGRDSPPNLDRRGTGEYICEHGQDCKKGGVARNGSLVVFRRNSEFKAHKKKHDRPYKCDLPNCPNHKGFARLDQLLRHKAQTKHCQ